MYANTVRLSSWTSPRRDRREHLPLSYSTVLKRVKIWAQKNLFKLFHQCQFVKKGPLIDKNVNLHVWGDFKILRTKITLKLKIFFFTAYIVFWGYFFHTSVFILKNILPFTNCVFKWTICQPQYETCLKLLVEWCWL